jgi:vitamin B12 transporter
MHSPQCFRARAAGAFALTLIGAALPAASQSPPVYQGRETVVTAGRVEQRLADSLRSVVVVTARDIESSGQLSIAQVLQQFGGVETATSGGIGSATSIFLRGSNSAHALVLVDGVRVSSATLGTTALENIPLGQIERIEIVSGPASGLYGSDAIGGVIQVFTKGSRQAAQASVVAGLGTDNTRALRAQFGGAAGETSYSLAAGYFETDGHDSTRPTISYDRHNPDDDGYRNTNVSGKISHRFGERHEIGASVLHSDGRTEFDNGLATDDRTEQALTTVSAYSRNRLTDRWESLVRLARGRDDSESVGSFPDHFRTDQDQALWQNTFRLEGQTIVAGLEYLGQEVDATTAYEATRRTVRSAFAGYVGELGSHALEANVRRDDNSQFGSPTTGSVAYGYQLAHGARLRAVYGEGFHAPSFNDLYYPDFGNPELKPERSRSGEIGLQLEGEGQRLSATAFDNRIEDLIVFYFDPDTQIFGPANLAKARIRGVDLAWEGRFADFRLRAKGTFQDPVSDDTGLQLPRRARQFGSFLASRSFGAWTVGAEVVASAHRFETADESPSARMAGYAIMNLTASWAFAAGWQADLRWNNVTDKDYEQVQGYRTPGGNVFLSVKWTPGA